jgi:hypothetical protein
MSLAATVVAEIEESTITPALALSALAREPLEESNRKATGAYHTDFRLAERLAELTAPRLTHHSKVIDPACGAGILLVALSIAVCGLDRMKISLWLANGIFAADLSSNSLRATLLALASLTDDLSALRKMRARWLCGDSLIADKNVWTAMAPDGFDAVIGNPPWEKVKLSRHEFLKSTGASRHYGADTKDLDEKSFNAQRDEIANYSRQLLTRYPDLGCGDPDLYIAFTDLFFELCRPGGIVTALVPGGLIRSQGTLSVRRKIFDSSQSISLSIIDNRSRFFAIDSRFKFLAIALVKASTMNVKREPITLRHERGTNSGVEVFGSTGIGRSAMAKIRHDLSLPEVRSQAEWKIFLKVSKSGCSWDEPGSGWSPKFCREVDMTKQRPNFLTKPTNTSLALVEGRMVQHHRFGVKGHVSGTGRKAIWEAFPIGESRLSPQFWIEPQHIPEANKRRAELVRVGFCDIAGQTNERSLMAALIPAGVICGNKVPTILFPEDPSTERLLVWTAIANSFAFDWMLRRVLTTTVNYFLLQSVPLPGLVKNGLPWQRLVSCAAELAELDTAGATQDTLNRVAQLRAEIDVEIAVAYGLNLEDIEKILQDFTILDRGQPAIAGETKSTITRDTVLATLAKRIGLPQSIPHQRVQAARALSALPYIPYQTTTAAKDIKRAEAIHDQ